MAIKAIWKKKISNNWKDLYHKLDQKTAGYEVLHHGRTLYQSMSKLLQVSTALQAVIKGMTNLTQGT